MSYNPLRLTTEQEIGLRASLDPDYQNLPPTELYELLSERLQNIGLAEDLAEFSLGSIGRALGRVGKRVIRTVPSVISGGVRGLALGGPVGAAIGAGGGLVKGLVSSPSRYAAYPRDHRLAVASQVAPSYQVAPPPPPYQVAPPYQPTQPYLSAQPYDPYAYEPYGPSEPYPSAQPYDPYAYEPYGPSEPYPSAQPYDPYAYEPYGPSEPFGSISLGELVEPNQAAAPAPVTPQVPAISQAAPGAVQTPQKETAVVQLIKFLQSNILPQTLTSLLMGSFGKKDLKIGGLRVSQGDVLNLLNKLTSSALKEAAENYTTSPAESYVLESGKDPLNLDDRTEALWDLLQKQPEFRDARDFDE